jgi:hypothetical protein
VHIDAKEIEETGEYDLEGLFIRLDHAINSIGAKRVVLDTNQKNLKQRHRKNGSCDYMSPAKLPGR